MNNSIYIYQLNFSSNNNLSEVNFKNKYFKIIAKEKHNQIKKPNLKYFSLPEKLLLQ